MLATIEEEDGVPKKRLDLFVPVTKRMTGGGDAKAAGGVKSLLVHPSNRFPFALASGHSCQSVHAREILRWLLPLLHILNL